MASEPGSPPPLAFRAAIFIAEVVLRRTKRRCARVITRGGLAMGRPLDANGGFSTRRRLLDADPGGGVKLGAPQTRDANTTYTAEEAGFLHGGIDITQEGRYLRLFAYAAQSASALSQMVAAIDDNPPAACTAAHLWSDSDRICPQGAIFLPVPRGTSYQAVLDRWAAGAAGVNIVLNWTPLTAV
jgi:hypothetical protein